PTPTPTPTPTLQGSQAWRVVIRVGNQQLDRVVIADNLVDAASTASDSQRAGVQGEVVSVTWVGELL
ncbi:MAG: hypothetical protein JRI25_08980, partial [Deltaproteobacteria bacterium]|nr:hypothetical protein [Deltaproteobacteria bacterium]